MNAAAPRLGKWGALGILMVLAFLNYMDRNLVYPLLPLIGKSLNMSVAQLGALSTGFHVVYALTAPLVGVVSDRVSRKLVLLVALVSWSCITALSGTASGFAMLLLWRSLTGLGEGGYFPTAVSLIGDLFPPNQRGLAIALHGVCTTLGGSAGYAAGGLLGERFGWRMPFFMALLPGLLLALVLWRFLDEPPRGVAAVATRPLPQEPDGVDAIPHNPYRAPGRQPAPPARRSYVQIVTSAPVLMTAFAACAGAFTMTGLNTFLPYYLVSVRGQTVAEAGVLTGTFFTATLIGQLAGGLLSDRLVTHVTGARPLLIAASYLLAAPATLMIGNFGPLSLALTAYGVTQVLRGFAEPNIYGTIMDSTPSTERGSAQGFLLMLSFVGSSAAGGAAGLLITLAGFGTALGVLSGSALLSGVLALGLAIYVRHAVRA